MNNITVRIDDKSGDTNIYTDVRELSIKDGILSVDNNVCSDSHDIECIDSIDIYES